MSILFLTAFLACSSEPKETTKTIENKTTTESTGDEAINTTSTTPVVNKTTNGTANQTLETQTTEVKEFVQESVNTSETE